MSWQAQTELLRLIVKQWTPLEFHYDHHDHTVYALYGNMQLPTRAEFEELVEAWRAFYDSVPADHVQKWNQAMGQRFTAEAVRSTKSTSFVYLAHSETGHYKIGLSVGPVERIKIFDTKMPIKVELVHTFETDSAREAEGALHGRYAEKHHQGEWFNLTPEDVAEIKRIYGYSQGRWFVHQDEATDQSSRER